MTRRSLTIWVDCEDETCGACTLWTDRGHGPQCLSQGVRLRVTNRHRMRCQACINAEKECDEARVGLMRETVRAWAHARTDRNKLLSDAADRAVAAFRKWFPSQGEQSNPLGRGHDAIRNAVLQHDPPRGLRDRFLWTRKNPRSIMSGCLSKHLQNPLVFIQKPA